MLPAPPVSRSATCTLVAPPVAMLFSRPDVASTVLPPSQNALTLVALEQFPSSLLNCFQPAVLPDVFSSLTLTLGRSTVKLGPPELTTVQVAAVISPSKVMVPWVANAACVPARIPAPASKAVMRDSFMFDSIKNDGKLASRR